MPMKSDEEAEVCALGQEIGLTNIRKAISEFEMLCNAEIETAENFKNAVQIVALGARLIRGPE